MMDDKLAKEEREKKERQTKFQADVEAREHMRQIREKRTKAAACRYLSKNKGKKSVVQQDFEINFMKKIMFYCLML